MNVRHISLSFPNLKSKFIPFPIYFLVIFFLLFPIHARSEKLHRYIIQADRELLSRKYDKAIVRYLKALTYAPWKQRMETWDDLGFAYLQKKEIKKAKTFLIQSLSVHPENFNPRFYLAAAHILSNEIDSASEFLQQIEKNIHFDSSWMEEISNFSLQKPNGQVITSAELERIKDEKGIYLEEKNPHARIIHLDAFDERNEAVFYFAQGIVFKAQGDLTKSEKRFLQALEAGYNEREVRIQLADSYLKQGLKDKAAEQLQETLVRVTHFPEPFQIVFTIHHRLNPPNDLLIFDSHKKFLKELGKGKVEKAIRTLEEALDASEHSFLLNHNLALLYFDAHKIKKAKNFCSRALWYKDEYQLSRNQIIGCHDLMGNIFFHQNQLDNALEEFQNILRIDSRNALAHYNLGSVFNSLGNGQQAELEWKKAIEYEGISPFLTDEKKTPREELKIFLTVKKKSISFLSHLSLGQLYMENNLIEKASKEFEAAMKIKPDDSAPYFKMAQIYLRKGEITKASAFLEKYLYLGGERNTEVEELLLLIKKKKNKKGDRLLF